MVIDKEYAIENNKNSLSKQTPKNNRTEVYSKKASNGVGLKTEDKPRVLPNEQFGIDTASSLYLQRWGLSAKQAEVLVRYRDASGGIFSEEHLRRCYVVSDTVASAMAEYVVYSRPKVQSEHPAEKPSDQPVEQKAQSSSEGDDAKIEINSADSAMLVAIKGIGPKSALEIVKYRKYLGGYHSVEQIRELKCITDENFALFSAKIVCDSCKISKIDINFASHKTLERHPYVSALALRRIIKQRQLKGGWSRIEEMIEQKILSEEEAKRLAPYLRFEPRATE